MLMDYRGADRFPKRNPSWVKRFIHAIHGILYGFQTEKNFRFHVIAAITVMLVAFLLQISRLEWICVLFAIGIVMGAELLNSAIERYNVRRLNARLTERQSSASSKPER